MWIYVVIWLHTPIADLEVAPRVVSVGGPFETQEICEEFLVQQEHPRGYAAGCLFTPGDQTWPFE